MGSYNKSDLKITQQQLAKYLINIWLCKHDRKFKFKLYCPRNKSLLMSRSKMLSGLANHNLFWFYEELICRNE